MSLVSTCNNCQENISSQLEIIRQIERRNMQEEAIPRKAQKTATSRTAVGLYVAGHNPTAVKVGVVVGAFIPQEWAKNVVLYSDKGVNWSLKKIPEGVKSHIGKMYLMHVAWVAANQSIPLITPFVNTAELAIGFKLGVQGSKHIKELKEAGADKDKKKARIVDSVAVCASTYAFAHMITKGQNSAAAAVGGTVTAAFPKQIKVVHEKIDATISKISPEASLIMCALYATHEVYLEYFAGTIPYVTEGVCILELGASFYAGVKYFLGNERQAVETLKNELPNIEDIE